jgi:ATP-binding protein involved in chromosome partitioning
MFTKVDVPILGLVQNMSSFVCTNCGHEHHLFGKEGVQRLADEYKCDVLCDVPLNVLVRETCDQGQPACLDAQNPVFPHFKLMATKLLDKLSLKL